MKAVIENRKAKHNYFIEDTLECGIELFGNEVKSIRNGMASINEAWIKVDNNQLILTQMHITPWETSNRFDIKPRRDIRLLAHRREIQRLEKSTKLMSYTIIPLKVYFTKYGKCKVLVGICKGKKDYDKREADKIYTMKKEMNIAIKNYKRHI